MRVGNVLEVVSKNFGYLNFAEATLVPFEPNLIEKSILTEYEVRILFIFKYSTDYFSMHLSLIIHVLPF